MSEHAVAALHVRNLSSLDRITDRKARIAALEKYALQERMDKRNRLNPELAHVDAQIARMSGKPVGGKSPRATAST